MSRLFIFDLDGVLFESRDMHFETLNEALEYRGFDPISREDHIARFNGLPTKTKLEMLGIKGRNAIDVSIQKQAATLGWVHKNVRKNDALFELFRDLRLAGWKIAVASNAVTVTVIRALQLLGLWDLCDFVISGDRALPKPDPAMFVRCMQVCDANPETTWIVEDSPVGIEGATASGAHVVRVEGPHEVNDAVRTVMEVQG